jgi:hypothetical protein
MPFPRDAFPPETLKRVSHMPFLLGMFGEKEAGFAADQTPAKKLLPTVLKNLL